MFQWGIGIFFLHDTNGRALQANRAGPNWPNPSSPFLLMSTGNTKALPFEQCKKNLPMPHNICVKFDSRQRKKLPTFFLSSHVKFYANVNLKCRHFFILSQTQEANLESQNFFVCLESNWKRKKEKKFRLGIKKIANV